MSKKSYRTGADWQISQYEEEIQRLTAENSRLKANMQWLASNVDRWPELAERYAAELERASMTIVDEAAEVTSEMWNSASTEQDQYKCDSCEKPMPYGRPAAPGRERICLECASTRQCQHAWKVTGADEIRLNYYKCCICGATKPWNNALGERQYERTGPECDECGRPSEDRIDCGDFRCPECDIDWWQET